MLRSITVFIIILLVSGLFGQKVEQLYPCLDSSGDPIPGCTIMMDTNTGLYTEVIPDSTWCERDTQFVRYIDVYNGAVVHESKVPTTCSNLDICTLLGVDTTSATVSLCDPGCIKPTLTYNALADISADLSTDFQITFNDVAYMGNDITGPTDVEMQIDGGGWTTYTGILTPSTLQLSSIGTISLPFLAFTHTWRIEIRFVSDSGLLYHMDIPYFQWYGPPSGVCTKFMGTFNLRALLENRPCPDLEYCCSTTAWTNNTSLEGFGASSEYTINGTPISPFGEPGSFCIEDVDLQEGVNTLYFNPLFVDNHYCDPPSTGNQHHEYLTIEFLLECENPGLTSTGSSCDLCDYLIDSCDVNVSYDLGKEVDTILQIVNVGNSSDTLRIWTTEDCQCTVTHYATSTSMVTDTVCHELCFDYPESRVSASAVDPITGVSQITTTNTGCEGTAACGGVQSYLVELCDAGTTNCSYHETLSGINGSTWGDPSVTTDNVAESIKNHVPTTDIFGDCSGTGTVIQFDKDAFGSAYGYTFNAYVTGHNDINDLAGYTNAKDIRITSFVDGEGVDGCYESQNTDNSTIVLSKWRLWKMIGRAWQANNVASCNGGESAFHIQAYSDDVSIYNDVTHTVNSTSNISLDPVCHTQTTVTRYGEWFSYDDLVENDIIEVDGFSLNGLGLTTTFENSGFASSTRSINDLAIWDMTLTGARDCNLNYTQATRLYNQAALGITSWEYSINSGAWQPLTIGTVTTNMNNSYSFSFTSGQELLRITVRSMASNGEVVLRESMYMTNYY